MKVLEKVVGRAVRQQIQGALKVVGQAVRQQIQGALKVVGQAVRQQIQGALKVVGRAVRQQIQGALDPLQFAYRAGRGVEDASLMLLHSLSHHLEGPLTHARLLFIDFSSAFITLFNHTC